MSTPTGAEIATRVRAAAVVEAKRLTRQGDAYIAGWHLANVEHLIATAGWDRAGHDARGDALGWSCSCGAGNVWTRPGGSRGPAAASRHVAAARRREATSS